jgi:hypothetical protein
VALTGVVPRRPEQAPVEAFPREEQANEVLAGDLV